MLSCGIVIVVRRVVAWSLGAHCVEWDFDIGRQCSARKRAWRVNCVARRPNDPALLMVRLLERFFGVGTMVLFCVVFVGRDSGSTRSFLTVCL